jgi:hypothetical protein
LTKDILSQYIDLREEAKDLKKRIERLESDINRIEDEKCVSDSVTGGMGGTQHFMIRGFPYPEYSKKKTKLYLNKDQLEAAESDILQIVNAVEEYIQSIEDSRIRRIIRYKYIDDMTWPQVAMHIGGKRTTDESVRKEFERFMQAKITVH